MHTGKQDLTITPDTSLFAWCVCTMPTYEVQSLYHNPCYSHISNKYTNLLKETSKLDSKILIKADTIFRRFNAKNYKSRFRMYLILMN